MDASGDYVHHLPPLSSDQWALLWGGHVWGAQRAKGEQEGKEQEGKEWEEKEQEEQEGKEWEKEQEEQEEKEWEEKEREEKEWEEKEEKEWEGKEWEGKEYVVLPEPPVVGLHWCSWYYLKFQLVSPLVVQDKERIEDVIPRPSSLPPDIPC